ncbi:MAG: alpha/beta fold hydrolase [Marivibrio sp.]|uniref:alpha/beta fold hydrolase n=1 Tax=Marivibrio sp. TaxID=2039719 RepID=UPI0032ECA471
MTSGSTPVLALHCSGAGPKQWRGLASRLGLERPFLGPSLFGAPGGPVWEGARAFTLAEEAAPLLRLIDEVGRPVHLVGHSYGGGVALHLALARPNRVASLSLYEPSAFHLLKMLGAAGVGPFAEIAGIARAVAGRLAIGDRAAAMEIFVDYWGGSGDWASLPMEKRTGLLAWASKAALDFHALFEEPSRPDALKACRIPSFILRGATSPEPSRVVAEQLAAMLPAARLSVVEGAGHMGPFTHRETVETAIVAHIERVEGAHAARPDWKTAA